MCYPAASCVSGMMASSLSGTKLVLCAAVGHCWASPPSHLHAAPRVWSSGCKRSRGSTSRNVRTGAPGHSYGSLCPLCLHALPAEGLLGRCRSTTRHEPSVASQVAAVDSITAPPEPSGDVRVRGGLRSLTGGACVPLLPVVGHIGGLATVLSPLRLPLPPTLAAESLRPSCYNPHKDVLA